MSQFFSIVLASLIALPAFATSEEECIQQATDISDKIRCLEQVKQVLEQRDSGGLRLFNIQFRQLVDHEHPGLGHFDQKLVLFHRAEEEPMVLQTSGYMIYRVALTAMARMFETNQLQIEHRFFASSMPVSQDWRLLNIKQSADDFHAITQAFKKIYPSKWVNTGASKGGMTSTYHRFFYPDDLDGTVADVAPLSFSRTDQRYNRFLENVGGSRYSQCRLKLKDFQRKMLLNRETYLPMIDSTSDYSRLGGKEVAFEHAVIEAPYYFWQYGNPDNPSAGCRAIPEPDQPEEMFEFLNRHADLNDYTTSRIAMFQPYYYQAATQLGGPDNLTSHLEALRLFEFDLSQYTPVGVDLPYDNSWMRAVDRWVRLEASEVLFVYGSYDPWTAAEYPVSETGKSVYKLFVPGGNHGVKFTDLPANDRQFAIDLIGSWLDKKPNAYWETKSVLGPDDKTLEDYEFEFRKKFKL